MKVLWVSWKDRRNPLAGGAETMTDQLLTKLAADKHQVTLLTAGFPGSEKRLDYHGYKIIRVGGRLSVYYAARKYLRGHNGSYDIVIEEVNTVPFFIRNLVKTKKYFLFFHQLAREVWWYEAPLPLAVIGYLIEPIYLWVLRRSAVITISASTKNDLTRFGFQEGRIKIISEGISATPLKDLKVARKYADPTVLSLGALRSMKRTLEQVKAFELAKKTMPNLKMILAGSIQTGYGHKVLGYLEDSRFKKDVSVLGSVPEAKKYELMQRSQLILVTSVKEGWGLIVTEANSQGTPAIVYNVDGLRDSVRNNQTGRVVSPNTPENLARAITDVLKAPAQYEQLRHAAWAWSKTITVEQAYKDLLAIFNNSEVGA